LKARITVCLVAAAGALAACGGGSSASATVGDCIDASKQVVDCSASDAKQKLVSDQSKANAIACVAIGSKPQVEVKVDGGTFCAQPN
jgi:hypothetical protein